MAVGETFELNSFRNWFAIESFMNAKVALPEMHYQVIDVNGNASDVVTITPNALNSNVAVMEAKHEGTAIVLVTYDAMTHMAGQTSTASHRFSAIWPELTGVFVVNVGADGSAIQTNMNLDRMDAVIEKDEARQLDAEHDILFYTEQRVHVTASARSGLHRERPAPHRDRCVYDVFRRLHKHWRHNR